MNIVRSEIPINMNSPKLNQLPVISNRMHHVIIIKFRNAWMINAQIRISKLEVVVIALVTRSA